MSEHTLSCKFPSEKELYRAYMPFVTKGGLFVRTDKNLTLDETVTVTLTLPDSPDATTFSGRVIWINPPSTDKEPGVGVELEGTDGKKIKQRIEGLLSHHLISNDPTDTV